MLVAALALVSCTKHELDPLTGVFPEATVVQLNNLTSCVAEKDAAERRVFTLDLTDGTTPMHLTLIGNKYFLTANQYTEALDAVAKNGNFVLGKTSIGGKDVKKGFINIGLLEEAETANGCENKYSIEAVVFLEDGSPYKAYWTGKIAFEKDAALAPDYFFTDTVAQDCTLEDGQTLVTDVESHTLVLNDASGNFAAQIKLIRSVGTKNLAGTYTVKEYAHEDLSAGNGFDLGVYFGLPAGSYVIGSYYLADGAVVIIDAGATISVSDMGEGVYSIDGDGFSFLCAPEGWVPGGATVCDMTDTVAQDCTLEDGTTLVEDVESHTLVLKDGEEFVAQIKLIRSVGTTDLTGTYTVKEYAHEDLSAGNGFDLGAMFGMGSGVWVIGTYYIKDGAIVIVEPGETITVTSAGENTYKFEGSSDWTFVGKLASSDPGVDPDPDPEPQNATLSQFLSFSSYLDYGVNLVGMNLATDGLVYTPADYAAGVYTDSYAGSGNVLKLEVYSADGTVAPGTYKACATGGTVGEGEFGIGYDGMFGASGTTWYTVTDGAADKGVYVTDGTVTVSENGGVYTIELKSSVVNATYTGKLGIGGGEDPAPAQVLFLNEFDCQNKQIEIYNASDEDIDMTGWILHKDESTWTIPADLAVVPAKGYAVYTCKQKDAAKGPTFGLSGTKGFIVILEDKDGKEIDKVDNLETTDVARVAIPDGKSWGRETDGAETFVLFETPSIGAPNGVSAPSAIELTQFLSLTSYVAYGANLVGMNLATDGLVYTPADYAAGIYTDSYAGSGNVLKLEVYSTDGNVAPGTYKACTTGGTVGEGEFGIGYDGMWGASGTTWYTITDGTADKGVYVTDGTVTVAQDGDNYTIEIASSVVNAKFVGKLSK